MTDDIDRIPCGYLVCGADGTLTEVNQRFLERTGFDHADLVGRRTFASLLSVGGRIFHETHFAPTLQMEGRADEIAFEIVCADGGRLPVLVNAVLEHDGVTTQMAVFAATDRRLYEHELLEAKRQAEESERRATSLAQTLQATLIPPAPPDVPGLDIAGAYRPAGRGDEVGGDFYDVFEIAEGDWVAVVGDVCGKGVEAAVVTATARHAIRALAVREREPSRLLDQLNDILLRSGAHRFCTVVQARLRQDGERWTARVGCGGNPLPVITRSDGGRPFGQPGSLVGAMAQVSYRDDTAILDRGDCLVLFTDGVTEARRGDELYGEERVVEWLGAHQGTADAVVADLLDEVMSFQDGVPRDDIVILAIRVP